MQIDQNDWRLLAEIAALEHAGYRFQSCHSSGMSEPLWVFTVMIDGKQHSMAFNRKKLKEEADLYAD